MTKGQTISTKRTGRSQRLLLPLSFAALSILYVLPLAADGTLLLGDDTRFHLLRIAEIAEHFKNGDFRPYTYTWTFSKISFPLGIFYPEFTLYPFALFTILFGGIVPGVYAGVVFYNFLTLVITYTCVRRMGGARFHAFFAALLYTFCTYRFLDGFTRFAMGEWISMTFLPLVFYGTYAILSDTDRQKKDWLCLPVGMTLLLYTHVLTPFLCIIFLLPVVIIVLIIRPNRLRKLLYFLYSVLLTLAASAVFLVPFGEQYLAQSYPQPSPKELADSAISVKDFVLSALRNSFRDNYAGQNIYNIGLLLFLTMIALVLSWKFLSKKGRIIGLLGILACLLATDLIPWGHLQNTPLRVIQFPWRFLTIASLLLSYSFGELVSLLLHALKRSKRPKTALPTAIAMTAVILVTFFASELDYYSFSKEVHTSCTDISDVLTTDSCHEDDYTPTAAAASLDALRSHEAIVGGEEISLAESSVQSAVNTQIFDDPALKMAENVDLPIAAYANLHVYQTGGTTRQELTYTVSDRGTIEITKTGEGALLVVYVPTPADWASIALSAAGWVLILLLWRKCHSPNMSKKR